MSKGAKERIVPVGGLAQKTLLRYVYHFRPESLHGSGDSLFLTLEGKSMSDDAIQLMIHRLGRSQA